MNFNCSLNVQSITKHHLFGLRIDSQLFVFRNNLLNLLFFHATVYTQARKHHSHTLRKVVEEHPIAKAIVKINTIISVVNVAKFAHHIKVTFEHSAHIFFKFDDLMTHCSNGSELMFHSKVDITCAH